MSRPPPWLVWPKASISITRGANTTPATLTGTTKPTMPSRVHRSDRPKAPRSPRAASPDSSGRTAVISGRARTA